jgi:polyphosphate kinase
VLLENVIMHCIGQLFEEKKILAVCPFRITRDSDLDIDEDSDDLMSEIQKSIKKRKRGAPVRLELIQKCDPATKRFLLEMLDVDRESVYEVPGPLDLTFLSKFANLPGCAGMCFKPIVPVFPPVDFWGFSDIFEAIREKDRMVHHPYESFDIVVDFIRAAAEDENVLAIKQTLYRVSGHSPIVAALMRAAENGKQVTVLVELKARFDEENNILWAKKLESAGCHVIYGLAGLKTHCKIALVVRREEDGIRRYLHLGTGNYNDSTAKIYTDLGLFTCKEPFGMDASNLFNVLTGYSLPPDYNEFVVAPHGMRGFFEHMILSETQNAREGLSSGITVKINSLVDERIISLLYDASRAGVKVRLIVRGICCLIPGLPGVSENIEVISIVGQLLEHSRIYRFENAGDPRIYLGSADWMPRNLDRRVELVFPVEDPDLKKRAFGILDLLLSDNRNARRMLSDKTYERIFRRGKAACNCQTEFSRLAREAVKALAAQDDARLLRPLHSPQASE